LKLENTPKAIEGETAIHILIDRLPDSYKAQGLLTKGLNLSFIETTAHLLANIKDSSSSGDNLSGNALLTRGRRNQQRDNSSRDSSANSNQSNGRGRGRGRGGRRGRGGHRGHRGQGNYNNRSCHWCHQRGHIDRDCPTKFLQLANGTAKQDGKGKAYVVTGHQGQQQPPPLTYPSQYPQYPSYPPQPNPSPAPPVPGIPQAYSTQTNPQGYPLPPPAPGSSAHLLLTRATYINNQDQKKDILSYILDSGATNHFSNHRTNMKDYKRFVEPKPVYLGDNTIIYAEGQGTNLLQIGPYILELPTWFVPDLAENLISTRLIDRTGYSLLIENDIVYIRHRDTDTIDWHRIADALHGDLYRVYANEMSTLDSPRALRTRNYSTLRMWHSRLGHREFRTVGKLMNLSVPRQLPVCSACQQGKMKASHHPPVLERCHRPFQCVHSDLVPLDGLSFGKSKYMLIFIDDYTRFAWTYFTSSSKAEVVFPQLERFTNMVLTQFNIAIQRWRTDGGNGEFINCLVTELNRRRGILHEVSTSGVKQQNGLIERRIQTLKNMDRSMRAGAGVLDDYRFQAESLTAANHITNILPTPILDGNSPYLLLYGKQPTLDYLKPWGCLVYIHQRPEHRPANLKSRSKPAMFIGYVDGSTSLYKCLDPITQETLNCSEIKFDEELFPGPWIKRPAGMSKSLAYKRNPPGSAVSATPGGQAALQPLPSTANSTLNPLTWSVPFSSMEPFWMQSPAARIALGNPLPEVPVPYMSGTRPIYNERGNVIFGTHEFSHNDLQLESVEAEQIVQGMESLSQFPVSAKAMVVIRVDHNGDPLSYKDAMNQDPDNWLPAVEDELKSHDENGTWSVQEISLLANDCKPIPGKWVFKRKLLPDGGIRFKARLVIRGFLQRYGIDFMETYAPTASLASFRLLVAIAVFNGWSLRNLDIITAFLYGDLNEDVYMGIPEGMGLDPKRYILKLRRSLYGLKQAPRIWWERMNSFLVGIRFHRCDSEPAIYTRNHDGKFIILLLFVDDILLTGNSDDGIEEFVKECFEEFKCRDLHYPKLFLGIHIEQCKCNDKVILHQRAYIERILERFNAPMNPTSTPMDPKRPLVEALESELLNEEDAAEYRAAVGALIYLMICTRPDIAFPISRLSKFVAKPGIKHAAALKRLFRYLRGTVDVGISFSAPNSLPSPQLIGYSDSDFAADLDNRRSTSGFIFLLNGGPISWKSKQQSLVTSSTHDAEYVGLAIASREVIWLRNVLIFLLPDYTEHTVPANTLFSDNQGAISTANKPIHAISNRSKHIDVRFHIIREAAANGLVRLEYVRTADMTADILTKALPRELHLRHMKGLGMEKTK
jgi:transposase InsO family protein